MEKLQILFNLFMENRPVFHEASPEKSTEGSIEDKRESIKKETGVKLREEEVKIMTEMENEEEAKGEETVEETKVEETKEQTLLEKAGIKIDQDPTTRKEKVYFDVEGVERSFLLTKDFKNKLLKQTDENEAKLMCYAKLLKIVGKGIDIKKHKVAGGNKDIFEKSNKAMKEFVQVKGKLEIKPETDRNYQKIGKFNGIEMYVDIKGNLVAKDGTQVTDESFTIEDKTTVEQIQNTKTYKTAVDALFQRQEALKKGYEPVGKDKEGNPLYVDGTGKFHDAYGKPVDSAGVIYTESTYRASTIAREREQENLANESKDKKEQFEAVVQRDIAKLQIMANQLAETLKSDLKEEGENVTTQKIRIDNEAQEKEIGAGIISREFAIYVDGRKTDYTVSTTYSTRRKEKGNEYKPEFAIRKRFEKGSYATVGEGQDVKLQKGFYQVLKDYRNENDIKNIEKAKEELKKSGAEITEPAKLDSLKVRDLTVIKGFSAGAEKILKSGKNFYEIQENLNALAENLKKELGNSEVSKIKLNILKDTNSPVLTWDKSNGEFITEKDHWGMISDLKMKQFGGDKNSEEYKAYNMQTRKERFNEKNQEAKNARMSIYMDKFEELTKNSLSVDYNISEMRKENIVNNWEHYTGTAEKVKSNLIQEPFNCLEERVPTVVANLINDGKIGFKELFKAIDISSIMRESMEHPEGIPEKFLKSPGAFMKEFKRLSANSSNLSKTELKRMGYMFDAVIVPCLELRSLIPGLRYDAKKEAAKEKATEELSEEQKEILSALGQFCGFQDRTVKGWERFLSKFSGGKKEITMADIDGKNFTLDVGSFQRNFNPKAAIAILANREGLYRTLENGSTELIKENVIAELNRIIKKGAISLMILEKGKGGNFDALEASKLVGSPEYNQKLAAVEIKDFKGEFTKEQLEAFQFGFVIDQETRFDKQIQEGIDTLNETNPVRAEILKQLINKGVPLEKVQIVQQKLALMAGVAVNNDGTFAGLGLGANLDLGNGYSLSLGLGADATGRVAGGVGLNVVVYNNNEGFTATASIGVSTAGIGAGIKGNWETGKKVDVSAFAGIGWSWMNPTAVGGVMGVTLSWNADKAFKERIETAEGKFFGPKLTAALDEMIAMGAISKEDRSNIEQQLRDKIKDGTLKDFNAPIVTSGGFQVVMLGTIPVPIISIAFNIGSVNIVTPNRQKVAGQLKNLSGERSKLQVREALDLLASGNAETKYVEGLDRLTYSADGKLMILEDKKDVQFDGITSSIEDYNKALAKAEVKLVKHDNERIEIQVGNTPRKDIHFNVDPLLESLITVQDSENGKIFLAGNIDDLIITRERFSLPFEQTKSGATMVDYITIKQKSSVQGEVDNRWIDKNAPYKLIKLMENKKFYRQLGAGTAQAGENILEVAGFSTKETKDLTPEDKRTIEFYLEKQPDLAGRLTQENLDEKENIVIGRKDEQSKSGERMLQSEYDKPQIDEEFLGKLNELKKDKNLMKQVGKTVGKGENLIKLLSDPKNGKLLEKVGLQNILTKGNEKLLNMVIMTLENEWFSPFYEKNNKNRNATLLKRLNTRVEFVKRTSFMPLFEQAYEKLDPKPENLSAKILCDNFFDKMFAGLRENLKNPAFDFTQMNVKDIPGGAEFFSGSRRYENGVRKGALAENINYESEVVDSNLVHKFGFLEGSTTSYKFNEGTEVDKATARILMEISNPTPENDAKFLDSRFAKRILNMDSLVLIISNDDYKKITEIEKDRTKLSDQAYAEAFGRFKALVTELQNAIMSGKSFEKKIPGTLATMKITFDTALTGGAYTKCANPSFYLNMKAKLEIYKGDEVVATMTETGETIRPEVLKQFISVGIGLATVIKAGATPTENKDGKYAYKGSKVSEPSKASQEQAGVQTIKTPDGTEVQIDRGNPSGGIANTNYD